MLTFMVTLTFLFNLLITTSTGANPKYDRLLRYDTGMKTEEFEEPEKLRVDTWEMQRTYPFGNPDGGAWKQGFPYEIDPDRFEDPITAHIFLWSHTDPGWNKRYDDYYAKSAVHIMKNIVQYLSESPDNRITWIETCYLQKFFDDPGVPRSTKDSLSMFVRNGQLEIATGSWVMVDEACTNYQQIIDQFEIGHEWLYHKFGVKPQVGWSVDPFGHSPIVPYILKRVGINSTLINRIHYALKRYLAKRRALEFFWRPQWVKDNDNSDDVLVHTFPFYIYDIFHTCGPNPKACGQLDFAFDSAKNPWGENIDPFTDKTLPEKVAVLEDQYKKKSMLFRTNQLLTTLGFDFYYANYNKMKDQANAYKRMAKYFDEHPELKLHLKESNITEYFSDLHSSKYFHDFPVVQGDFFTYSDVREDYWSGYFTTNPFGKRLTRILYSYTRSAQTLSALLAMRGAYQEIPQKDRDEIEGAIQESRRTNGLFQHHDAITGTSPDETIRDYDGMLYRAYWGIDSALKKLLYYALRKTDNDPLAHTKEGLLQSIEDKPERRSIIPQMHLVEGLKEDGSFVPVVVYNHLPRKRGTIVQVRLSEDTGIAVTDENGVPVVSQICPEFGVYGMKPTGTYVLSFPVILQPFSVRTFFVGKVSSNSSSANSDIKKAVPCTINVYREGKADLNSIGIPERYLVKKPEENGKAYECSENEYVKACFSTKKGTLAYVVPKMGKGKKVSMKERYKLHTSANNGVYVMYPSKSPQDITDEMTQTAYSTHGPCVDEYVIANENKKMRTSRVLKGIDRKSSDFVEVYNRMHIKTGQLVVSYETDIDTKGRYITDVNGFGLSWRFWREDKVYSANLFPVTSLMSWRNSEVAVNFHTAQSVGGTCRYNADSKKTTCEVLLGRNCTAVDKGLEKPQTTKEFLSIYRLSVEEVDESTQGGSFDAKVHMEVINKSPTVTKFAHAVSYDMHSPMPVFVGTEAMNGKDENGNPWKNGFATKYFAAKKAKLPDDVEIVSFGRNNFSTVREVSAEPDNMYTITLSRHLVAGTKRGKKCVDLTKLFGFGTIKSIEQYTLTYNFKEEQDVNGNSRNNDIVCLKRGDIKAYAFSFENTDGYNGHYSDSLNTEENDDNNDDTDVNDINDIEAAGLRGLVPSMKSLIVVSDMLFLLSFIVVTTLLGKTITKKTRNVLVAIILCVMIVTILVL